MMEYRVAVFDSEIQLRGAVEGILRDIEGVATILGHTYDLIKNAKYHIRERLLEGCLTKTLQESRNISSYLFHDRNRLLGNTLSKTLELWLDGAQLRYRLANPPNTRDVSEARELVDRGVIRYASIGFYPIADKSRWVREGNALVHEVHELKLREVSLVENPANLATSAYLRSEEAAELFARFGEEPGAENHSTAVVESLRETLDGTGEPDLRSHSEAEARAAIEVWRRRLLLTAMN